MYEFFTSSGRLAGIGELNWSRSNLHLRQVTQRLREVDGGERVWATWNYENHGETVSEEERTNFLTVANWRTLSCDQGPAREYCGNMIRYCVDLRDVRRLSREKIGGDHKIPWLLCKRTSSTDQNENPSAVGKGRIRK